MGVGRKNNQDGFYIDGIFSVEDCFRMEYYETTNDEILVAVTDGVGGTENGEFAVRKCFEYFRKTDINYDNIPDVINHLNVYITEEAKRAGKDTATTIAGILISSSKVYSFNVGDSRVYSINNGYLEKISKDDTATEMLKESDIIPGNEIIEKAPLLQSLGGKLQNIDCHYKKIEYGQGYLLCTDGLTDALTIDTIEDTLEKYKGNIKEQVKTLVELAKKASVTDNITVIIVSAEE